jgi:proline iminopeptidase
MKRLMFLLPVLFVLTWGAGAAEDHEDSGLFPASEPFDTGYLRVSEIHRIYYARYGNPEGKPVMCLHGGPGWGSYPRLTQYFDPERFHIVLHDQRGAGRSEPQGELRENTTPELVEDIERLRRHLDLGKVLIFGGSWGSTLAVAYAEAYPDKVTGMVLRGVFLGTEAEVDQHYLGSRFFFPEEYDALVSVLPDGSKTPHPDNLQGLITGDDAELRHRIIDALIRYEFKCTQLHVPDETVEELLGSLSQDELLEVLTFDFHYVTNRFFIDEGQLLRNAGKLAEIPVTIINGRYDLAAPPLAAFRLHRALPMSKLIIVEEAGHSETEPGITAALLQAVAQFE